MSKSVTILVLLIFFLNSCAGLLIKPAAKKEFNLGLSLFNRGKYEEAVPHFEKATEIEPEYSDAYLYLGRSLLNLQKWIEAIPPLRTAYRLSPEETKKEVTNILLDALIGAAISASKKGDFHSSTNALREAYELAPDSESIKDKLIRSLMNLGAMLLTEDSTDEAIDIFTEIIKLSPGNFDAFIGLAKSFFKSGDFIKALKAVRGAMAIDPESPDAKNLFQEITEK